MTVEATRQDDGSAALLAHRPDGTTQIKLRQGAVSWSPSSTDGAWVYFDLPPGAVKAGPPLALVALDSSGRVIAIDRRVLG
jgi:hypothetical protein